MRLIIAGSRDLHPDIRSIQRWIDFYNLKVTEVVCGMASGVDQSGYHYSRYMGLPVKRFYADWDRYGKAAGPIRNGEMARYADAALVIWDGNSPGSRNMIRCMETLKKPVYIEEIHGDRFRCYL